MNFIGHLISDYRARSWPSLEVPKLTPRVIILGLVLYGGFLAYGFYVFFNNPRAERFLMIMLIPVIFLLLRNRLFFLTLIISIQICAAFLAIGAPDIILRVIILIFLLAFVFVDIRYTYLAGVVSLYLFFIPSLQGFSITHALVLFLAFAYITIKIHKREAVIFKQFRINLPLFLFYIWSVITILWCQNFSYALFDIIEYLVLLLIYLLSYNIIDDEKMLRKVIWAWIIIGVGYSVVKPFAPSSTVTTDMEAYGTMMAVFSAKNTFSSLLNFSFFMMVAVLYIEKRFWARVIVFLSFIPMLVSNIIFGSKGGNFSLFIGVLLFLLMLDFRDRRWKRRFIKVVLLLTITVLVVVIPLIPLLFFPVGTLFNAPVMQTLLESYPTLNFRLDQWGYAAEMLMDYGNHLIGLGLAGYKALYPEYYAYTSVKYPYWYAHPHSYWIYTYTDMGIIGICLLHLFFILFVWKMGKLLISTRNRTIRVVGTALFCAIISFWIHGFIDFNYSESSRMWFFIGMGVALIFLDKRLKGSEDAHR